MKYNNPVLPDWFPYQARMLTKTRYKCAGWHLILISSVSWYLKSSSGFEKEGSPSLHSTLGVITHEYNVLKSEVNRIEREKKENAKIRT